MLDFVEMSILKYGWSLGNCGPCSHCYQSKSLLRKAKHLGFFLLLYPLAIGALAQQQPSSGYPDNTQSSNTQDCTDPLQSNSQLCIGQNQTNSLLTRQTGSAPADTSQTQNPNRNYSDTAQSARQSSGRNQEWPGLLPPQPLTEFQKFVASTTNQVLPIFGSQLFRKVPSTFAPLDMTPVPSDYVVGPGDELRIRVWGQVSFQANLRVDRSGEVYLPQVGPVHVVGIPFSALDTHLRSAIGRVYRNFDLTVDIGQIRAIQVYVAGSAQQPGVYTVSSLSTLVDTLFASGGPSIQGSMRHIELRRGSEIVTDFDLYDLIAHGDKSKDVKVLAGDVLFIPPVGPEVAVTGSVRNPAIYEMRAGESLAAIIADAGGVSSIAAKARISIERIKDHRDRSTMEVAYDAAGLATPLSDGDLVHVFSIIPRYQQTVTLRGNTANPGRFAWHPGMHISDLIPDRDSLITREYWWKRTQLGLPAPEFESTEGLSDLRQPREGQPVTLKTPASGNRRTLEPNGLQQNQYGSQQDQSGQVQGGYYDAQQNARSPQQDIYGQQQDQNVNAQQRGGNSTLAAQQNTRSSLMTTSAKRTEVRALAPEIDWDYAVIERLDAETLKTILTPFDLGKLVMQHDTSQDLELKAGDVVSIFSEADIRVPIEHQTKMVTLGGEITHAGVYTVQPGETFRHLVERAGGLTANSYLYGSEYTRESTRELQQARIDEYVQTLSVGIQRSNLAVAASAAGSAQDPVSSAAAQSNEQELLKSLRQIRATGRIVLRFTPDSSGINSLPDIAMEDGDHFIVPSVPATVNVVGAVYDQNSFLFTPGKRVGMYLQLAGGPDRDSDRKHDFLIRADGEVLSHNAAGGGLWSNQFNNLKVYPGDTIVVPEKIYKPGTLRSVIEYSQLVSNFALGAAALSVIHY